MKCPSCNEEVTHYAGKCSVCGKEVCIECWNPILGPEREGSCNVCIENGSYRGTSGMPVALEKMLIKRGIPRDQFPKVIPWNPYTLIEVLVVIAIVAILIGMVASSCGLKTPTAWYYITKGFSL